MLVNPEDFCRPSSAPAQANPNPQRQVAQLAVLGSAGCRPWGEAKPIPGGGEQRLEEMPQVLKDRVWELAGDWNLMGVGVEWVGTTLAHVPAGIVCALVVERRFLTEQACFATT